MQDNQSTDPQATASTEHCPRGKRHRGAALLVFTLGLVVGVAATSATDVFAGGGFKRMWGHHDHGWHHGKDPEKIKEHLQDMAAWALGSVDATETQREAVNDILVELVDDVYPVAQAQRDLKQSLIASLSRSEVDPAELETVRRGELQLAEKASAELVEAAIALSRVLEPEQRQALIQKAMRMKHH